METSAGLAGVVDDRAGRYSLGGGRSEWQERARRLQVRENRSEW
jgi:hypothetical protein